ncbi:DUF444 family protein [Acanthopleuribacter pedis]|uniref:DUF444 family protein n=1 Tax=Acanthopleuribacter pedis TaxID=442870 RepID=A0A8J7QHU6_9BACT|nr:DUF444 family protein [Acanthopleuribacter pedis]MBO1320846.1 DUF444 family protein [Acanthopleuribacter pedis]
MTNGHIPFNQDRINSDESEGAFNEYIDNQLNDLIEGILTDGNIEEFGERGSDLIIEMDDIQPPTFVYGDDGRGGGGGGAGPGGGGGKMSFSLPFEKLMELIAERLELPDLKKEGRGKIKQVSYTFKTFGPMGVILDKKRTFKRALKTSVATGVYNPDQNRYDVSFRRRDRRFKLPQRVEKPKFKAVVFYMGDISYSTYGERLELEKRLVKFIHSWLDYNYGPNSVEHRFFVHDAEAYEVMPEDFYRVANAGGTRASIVFDLVAQIAVNEYDPATTNFYGFYFGDGELFADDAKEIVTIIEEQMVHIFNRVGVVEVQPSRSSHLNTKISNRFRRDRVVRLGELKHKKDTIDVIKKLFGERPG